MPEDEPAAKITMTAIYNELRLVAQTVNSLNERLPSHIAQTEKDAAEVRSDVADHERRLRTIESRMWLVVGGFGLLAAVSPYLAKLLIP